MDLERNSPCALDGIAHVNRPKATTIPRPAHVPIGYVPELTRIAPIAEDIDVLFYGSLTEHRRAVLDELRARGFRVEWLFRVYSQANIERLAAWQILYKPRDNL